jgi:hypothetical protein
MKSRLISALIGAVGLASLLNGCATTRETGFPVGVYIPAGEKVEFCDVLVKTQPNINSEREITARYGYLENGKLTKYPIALFETIKITRVNEKTDAVTIQVRGSKLYDCGNKKLKSEQELPEQWSDYNPDGIFDLKTISVYQFTIPSKNKQKEEQERKYENKENIEMPKPEIGLKARGLRI